jgi:hypothetical protein
MKELKEGTLYWVKAYDGWRIGRYYGKGEWVVLEMIEGEELEEIGDEVVIPEKYKNR